MIMMACEIPNAELLPNAVHLRVKEDIDFLKAQAIAKEQARAYSSDAKLLSWFDKKLGRYSPHDVEGCAEGKPSWVNYAISRGGNLTIDFNDEDYVFVFAGQQGLS
ncbi:MAG: AF1514 family protein [Thermodesulfobacteriota bacterium]